MCAARGLPGELMDIQNGLWARAITSNHRLVKDMVRQVYTREQYKYVPICGLADVVVCLMYGNGYTHMFSSTDVYSL